MKRLNFSTLTAQEKFTQKNTKNQEDNIQKDQRLKQSSQNKQISEQKNQMKQENINQKQIFNQIYLFDNEIAKNKQNRLWKQFCQSKSQFQTVTNIIRAKFKKQLSIKHRRILVQKKQQILCRDVWYANNWKRDTSAQTWIQLLLNMEQAYCAKLVLMKTYSKQILKAVITPYYDCLRELDLQKNNIKNIQMLSFINAPSLISFNLVDNLIVSFKPLLKFNCPYLSQIYWAVNKFQVIEIQRHYLKVIKNAFNPLNSFKHETYLGIEDLRKLSKLEIPNKYQSITNPNIIKAISQQIYDTRLNSYRKIKCKNNVRQSLIRKFNGLQ